MIELQQAISGFLESATIGERDLAYHQTVADQFVEGRYGSPPTWITIEGPPNAVIAAIKAIRAAQG